MQKDQSSFFAQHKNSPKRFQKDVKEKKIEKDVPEFQKMTIFIMKVSY